MSIGYNNYMRSILIFSIMFALVFFPSEIAQAQLVTCTEGDQCNFCDLAYSLEKVVSWLVGVAILIATIGLMYAGFRMASSRGDVNTFTYAKTLFGNIVVGLFIIAIAWTVIDVIIKSVTGGDFGVWNEPEQCGVSFRAGSATYGVTLTPAQILELTETVDQDAVDNFVGDDGHGLADGAVPIGDNGGGGCTPPSDLRQVPGESNKYLRAASAQNYIAMRSAAAADGITLRLTSAWRSNATQMEIWNRHNCAARGCCTGTVAIPCGVTCGGRTGTGSNHNRGIAIDVSGSVRGTEIYNWLKANGGRYNFYNNLGADDPVHWSPSGR